MSEPTDNPMRHRPLGIVMRSIVILLALVGMLLTGFLFYESFENSGVPGCGPGSGCNTVLSSEWSTVAGIPITELMPADRVEALVQRTRAGGAEIVKLLKEGSAYYAPSAAVVEMIDAILHDRKKILPCAAHLNGEYGVQGLYAGVPVKLGGAGVEEIVSIELQAEEKAAFQRSVDAVKELVASLPL